MTTPAPLRPTAAQTRKGIALMLLAVLSFSSMDALVKGLVAHYPAPQIVWVRFAGQLVLTVLILNRRLPQVMATKGPWLHLARSMAQLGASGFFFLSLTHIGLAEATALSDTYPIFITLGAALFLRERIGPRRMLGVVVAGIGAMMILRPGAGVFTWAALLPLACALSYATAALLTRRLGVHESPWTAMVYAALFGTIVMGAALPAVWQPIRWPDLPLILTVGCLGTLAQLCLIRSFSLAEAASVAPFGYAGIVLATLWGGLFYREWPDGMTLAGAGIIVAAGLYVWWRETRTAAAQSPKAPATGG